MSIGPSAPLGAGDPAPDFALPAVEGEGTIALADYRGRSPVLLNITRGLGCSFCRRHLIQVGRIREALDRLGVAVLAVLAG